MLLGEEALMTKTSKSRWWRNPDKGTLAAQLLLIVVVVASCSINVVHGITVATDAKSSPFRIGAAGAASIFAPIVFFALAEVVLLTWNRELPRLGRLFLSGLVLLVGGAAGWMSFMDQVGFARTILHMPEGDLRAFALPLITDAAAVAMTLLLFMMKDAPVRKKKVKESKTEAAIATIGFFPKLRIRLFGGAATVPTLPTTAPTTPERHLIDTPSTTVQRQPIDSLATPEPVADRLSPTVEPTPVAVAESVNDAAVADDIDADSLAFAAEIRVRAKVNQSPETVHRVIEVLRETDGNLSQAAGAVNLSRDPARRIKAALAELEAEEPVLTAVG